MDRLGPMAMSNLMKADLWEAREKRAATGTATRIAPVRSRPQGDFDQQATRLVANVARKVEGGSVAVSTTITRERVPANELPLAPPPAPPPRSPEELAVDNVLATARAAWVEHKLVTFDHAMSEPFSAFVLASIERTLAGALDNLKRAEAFGHTEDADFAHDTVEMLTANRDALRAARAARGWSEDGDEAPEA